MPSAEYLIVAFPIEKDRRPLFDKFDEKSGLQTNLTRLIGRSLRSPGVTKSVLTATATIRKLRVEARIVTTHLRHDIAVLVVSIPAGASTPQIEKLAKRVSLKAISDAFQIRISREATVDGVIGFVGTDAARFETLPNFWLTELTDLKDQKFALELCIHLVARVAVERELLTWATNSKRFPLSSIWSGVVGFRVRRWPVELLTDRLSHTRKLQSLRAQFNLPNVRLETMARATSWWNFAIASLGTIAALVALFSGSE